MSLQDIPVHNSSTKAHVMFDNGSEITLVSNFFARKNNLPFERATYTMAAMGSKPTTYDSSNNGRIYTVPLVDSKGEIVLVKAHTVESILTEKTGRNQVKLNQNDFPHFSKEVLQEARKSLHNKYVDVLLEILTLLSNLYVSLDLVVKTMQRVVFCIDPGLELDMSF